MKIVLLCTYDEGYAKLYKDLSQGQCYFSALCTGHVWTEQYITLSTEQIDCLAEEALFGNRLAREMCRSLEKYKSQQPSEKQIELLRQHSLDTPTYSCSKWLALSEIERVKVLK